MKGVETMKDEVLEKLYRDVRKALGKTFYKKTLRKFLQQYGEERIRKQIDNWNKFEKTREDEIQACWLFASAIVDDKNSIKEEKQKGTTVIPD